MRSCLKAEFPCVTCSLLYTAGLLMLSIIIYTHTHTPLTIKSTYVYVPSTTSLAETHVLLHEISNVSWPAFLVASYDGPYACTGNLPVSFSLANKVRSFVRYPGMQVSQFAFMKSFAVIAINFCYKLQKTVLRWST